MSKPAISIRVVSRAISLLMAINRLGSATVRELAAATSIPYPTASRIMQALASDGVVAKDPQRKRYQPTALVRALSQGFQDDGRLVSAAHAHIVALTKKRLWPVSIVTRVGQMMVVRDTTHTQTSLTFYNVFAGHALPILDCASGRLYLALADKDERQSILEGIRLAPLGRRSPSLKLAETGVLFRNIAKAGYCALDSLQPRNKRNRISTIAVPILEGGRMVGALSLNFFASALRMNDAIQTHLGDLQRTAQAIEGSLRQI